MIVSLLLVLGAATYCVHGHGYMKKPAARNCMWRFGFKNPANYNDNELFCGGAGIMWGKNKGKCGICGDAYHLTKQPHMDGGRYANGIIAARYKAGATIDVEIKLSASHLGYFQFRIGEYDNSIPQADDYGHLKGHLLQLATGGTKYMVTGQGARPYNMQVVLPAGLKCKRCVMQWWYRGGNNWGCDDSGCGLGKGPQETFVNCADVSIE